jgi:hypothetical protein
MMISSLRLSMISGKRFALVPRQSRFPLFPIMLSPRQIGNGTPSAKAEAGFAGQTLLFVPQIAL